MSVTSGAGNVSAKARALKEIRHLSQVAIDIFMKSVNFT